MPIGSNCVDWFGLASGSGLTGLTKCHFDSSSWKISDAANSLVFACMIFVWRLAKVAEVLSAVADFRLSVWRKSCGWESVSKGDESLAILRLYWYVFVSSAFHLLCSSHRDAGVLRLRPRGCSVFCYEIFGSFCVYFYFSLWFFLAKFYFGGIGFLCLMTNTVIKALWIFLLFRVMSLWLMVAAVFRLVE